MSTLDDRLDADYAPAWRPAPGEKITGTVTALDVRDGAYGSYPIVTVDTGTGEVALHAFHEVLTNELAKLAPKIGDWIGVKYVGKHERGYHVYKVRRDGDDGGFAWGQFGADEPAAPPASDIPNDGFPQYGEPRVETKDGDDDLPF